MVTRVCVPFTEGRYLGGEERPNTAVLPVEAKVRELGISSTNTDKRAPRKGTSEAALQMALDYAKQRLGQRQS